MRASLGLLRDEPVLFVPKLVSTALGALWFIGFLESSQRPVFYLLSMPIILGVGFASSMMVSAMVEKENKTGISLLASAARECAGKGGAVLTSTALITGAVLASSLPLSAGLYIYLSGGSVLAAAAGGVLTLAMTVAVSVLLYFYPVTAVETGSGIRGAVRSAGFSRSHARDSVALALFSAALAGAAFVSTGTLETAGYTGLIASRLLSGVVNTYVFTVGPTYYLD